MTISNALLLTALGTPAALGAARVPGRTPALRPAPPVLSAPAPAVLGPAAVPLLPAPAAVPAAVEAAAAAPRPAISPAVFEGRGQESPERVAQGLRFRSRARSLARALYIREAEGHEPRRVETVYAAYFHGGGPIHWQAQIRVWANDRVYLLYEVRIDPDTEALVFARPWESDGH